MPTQRTVLFLGAGASKALGYPLTAEIFPRILERLNDGSLFQYPNVIYALPGEHEQANPYGYLKNAVEVLKQELEELFPGILWTIPLPQITEVLSLLDHLIFTGSSAVPQYPRQRLTRLRALLERAVATVVTEPENTRDIAHLALVERLIKWIVAEAGKAQPQKHLITVITTNYDLAVEKPLADAVSSQLGPNRIDYGFNWRDPFQPEEGEEIVQLRPSDAAVAFYKLHGSINWLRCPLCEHVYVSGLGETFHHAFASRMRQESTCTCGNWPLGTLLVAPSMVRDIRDPNLLSIWQAALEAMRLAQRWVVVGYSLPPEDLAIRSMFLRASHARGMPPWVEIYEHGDHPEVEARYRLLLQNVSYDGGGFEKFINGLAVA